MLTLKDHLCFRLYTAARLIMQGYTEQLTALGLTYPKYLVLLTLDKSDTRCVTQVCEQLYLDSGTISPLLKGLEKDKLIKRERSADDDRVVLSRLTRKGEDVRTRAVAVALDVFCRSGMSPEDAERWKVDFDGLIPRLAAMRE